MRLGLCVAERPEGPTKEEPPRRLAWASRPSPALLCPPSDGRIWVERYYWDCNRRKTYYYSTLPSSPLPPQSAASIIAATTSTSTHIRGKPVGQLFEPPSGAAYVVRQPQRVLSDLERGSTDSSPLPCAFAGPERLEELRYLTRYRFTRQELCELPLPSPTPNVSSTSSWKRWFRWKGGDTHNARSGDAIAGSPLLAR